MANPLLELTRLGQSIWYDQMHRSLLTEGHLARMIEEDGLQGLTSNPTIFDKAISGGREYDDDLRRLTIEGRSTTEIYEDLTRTDIAGAADRFRPLYDHSRGEHGYVSLEVDPRLAHDTEATVEEAIRHFKALDRPNVMIKIPATDEGIPAIERAIAAGLNVNVTLIFSREVYARVIDAYILGLERRLEAGHPIDSIASVASFFVSRIDNKVDAILTRRMEEIAGRPERETLASLRGKAAIANAKLAYQLFRRVFEGDRFAALRARGARVQRPLWASTSTKNPEYRDVLYVETLIGRDTVNTLPPATFDAFRDHGTARLTIEEDLEEATQLLIQLEGEGIDLEQVTRELTTEGVESFASSFRSLMGTIELRRDLVLRSHERREDFRLGAYEPAFRQTLEQLETGDVIARIWKKDSSVWKQDEAHHALITNALGWLSVVDLVDASRDDLAELAEEVRQDFDTIVLLGMGGSSLSTEVLRRSFGRQTGWPEMIVLDSVVPDTIESVERRIRLDRTLFLVASKSGTTIEPMSLYRYFFDKLAETRQDPGTRFIAITDVGTPLHKEAGDKNFRRVFVNPSDIGGRYSALSYFGAVPAALMGIDLDRFLQRATHAMHACRPHVSLDENPGARLGAALGSLASTGRDNLTIVAEPPVDSLGLWIEQLIAESTGKEGNGILPITGEPLAEPELYAQDRLFVHIMVGEGDAETSRALDHIAKAGHPVIELRLRDPLDLADQFYIWEIATAVAGSLLGINPFDQPDVQAAKDRTGEVLAELNAEEAPRKEYRISEEKGVEIWAGSDFREIAPSGARPLSEVLGAHLRRTPEPGYVAFLSYIQESPERDAAIGALRDELRHSAGLVTVAGYGPRYLHSTGQLFKGGPPTGLFVLFTADAKHDRPIPDAPYGFAALTSAQARGDFLALEQAGRNVIRVHLGNDIDAGLGRVHQAVREAMTTRVV